MFAASAGALVDFNFVYIEPILANRLVEKGLSVLQIGLFFAIFPACYLPACILVRYIPKNIEKSVGIIIGSSLVCVSYLCIGPSEILHFPDSLALMGVGYALAGATLPLMWISALPEMVECSLEYFPGQDREVNSMAAGVYTSCLGIGMIVSPIYGALLE